MASDGETVAGLAGDYILGNITVLLSLPADGRRPGTYEFGTRDCTNTPANQRGIEKSIDVKNFTASSESVHISLTH